MYLKISQKHKSKWSQAFLPSMIILLGGVMLLGLLPILLLLKVLLFIITSITGLLFEFIFKLFVKRIYILSLGRIHVFMSRRKSPHSRFTRLDMVTKKGGLISIHTIGCLADNYSYIIVSHEQFKTSSIQIEEEKALNEGNTDIKNYSLSTDCDTRQPLYGLVIDAGDDMAILDALSFLSTNHYGGRQIILRAILTTHHHWDHQGGNRGLVKYFGKDLKVYGSWRDAIDCVTDFIDDYDNIIVNSIDLEVIAAPGHTNGSVMYRLCCWNNQDCVFTGDTLFLGGCGGCFEGRLIDITRSFWRLQRRCNADTLLFPGHEYTIRMLSDLLASSYCPRTTPDYFALCSALHRARHLRSLKIPAPTVPYSLKEEIKYNYNFAMIKNLAEKVRHGCLAHYGLSEEDNESSVMLDADMLLHQPIVNQSKDEPSKSRDDCVPTTFSAPQIANHHLPNSLLSIDELRSNSQLIQLVGPQSAHAFPIASSSLKDDYESPQPDEKEPWLFDSTASKKNVDDSVPDSSQCKAAQISTKIPTNESTSPDLQTFNIPWVCTRHCGYNPFTVIWTEELAELEECIRHCRCKSVAISELQKLSDPHHLNHRETKIANTVTKRVANLCETATGKKYSSPPPTSDHKEELTPHKHNDVLSLQLAKSLSRALEIIAIYNISKKSRICARRVTKKTQSFSYLDEKRICCRVRQNNQYIYKEDFIHLICNIGRNCLDGAAACHIWRQLTHNFLKQESQKSVASMMRYQGSLILPVSFLAQVLTNNSEHKSLIKYNIGHDVTKCLVCQAQSVRILKS